MRCDRCGAELVIGLWPFCPHGVADHFGDEPIESYVDPNIAPGGTDVGYDAEGNPFYGHRITTRGERRKLMSKNHLEYLDVSKKKRGAKLYFFGGGK